MTHLLTEAEMGNEIHFDTDRTYPCLDGSALNTFDVEPICRAQLRKTVAKIEAFPGDSRYVALPREWIAEAKKELGL